MEPVVPGHVQQRQRERHGQQQRAGRGHVVRPARAAPVRGLRDGERRPAAAARLAVVASVVPVAVVRRLADDRRIADGRGLGFRGRLDGSGARHHAAGPQVPVPDVAAPTTGDATAATDTTAAAAAQTAAAVDIAAVARAAGIVVTDKH